MKIKSFLAIGGCSVVFLSSLLSHSASANFSHAAATVGKLASVPIVQEVSHNGLPHGIDPAILSGKSSGVIHQSAPAQPGAPGRAKFLPPQPAGVLHQNAPQAQRCRTC